MLDLGGNAAVGFGLESIVTDVEGHSGTGFVFANNILLDVQDEFGSPVRRGTLYTLNVAEVGGNTFQVVISHEPSTPFEELFTDGAVVTFNLSNSLLFADYSEVITIQVDTLKVVRVRLAFREAYFRITKKRFF